MKLSELTDILYRIDTMPLTYVCDCDIENPSEFNVNDFTVLTIQSMLRTKAYIQPKYADAEVKAIYALDKDKFIVEIDCEG